MAAAAANTAVCSLRIPAGARQLRSALFDSTRSAGSRAMLEVASPAHQVRAFCNDGAAPRISPRKTVPRIAPVSAAMPQARASQAMSR